MPPRNNRPSKFASTATPAQSSGGGGGWQDISPTYGYQEGTPNEGSPLITGFQDTTPGWRRFLAGLGGLQGVDVNAMNMQLALSQQAQERASQEARGLQADRLRAEYERMVEENKLRKGTELKVQTLRNKGSIETQREQNVGQINLKIKEAELALAKAEFDNNAAEKKAAKDQLRMLEKLRTEEDLKAASGLGVSIDDLPSLATERKAGAKAKLYKGTAKDVEEGDKAAFMTEAGRRINKNTPSAFDQAYGAELAKQHAVNYRNMLTEVDKPTFYPGTATEPSIRFSPAIKPEFDLRGQPLIQGAPARMDVMRPDLAAGSDAVQALQSAVGQMPKVKSTALPMNVSTDPTFADVGLLGKVATALSVNPDPLGRAVSSTKRFFVGQPTQEELEAEAAGNTPSNPIDALLYKLGLNKGVQR